MRIAPGLGVAITGGAGAAAQGVAKLFRAHLGGVHTRARCWRRAGRILARRGQEE